jgi:PAS domain S-box-containing protein
LESLSLLLGPTIACQHAETVLAQHTAMLDAAIDSLDSMVLFLSSEGKIVRLNRPCEEITGFTPEELQHRHFWGAYLLPADVATAQKAFGKLRQGQSPVKCELFVLTKSGKRRRFSWTFSLLTDNGNGEAAYMASGIDTTKQRAVLENQQMEEVFVSNILTYKKEEESPAGPPGEDDPTTDNRLSVPNRRQKLRTDFPYFQLIGPILNGQLPQADDYQEVRCRDISPTGFAYVAKEPPNYQALIVALGAYPSQVYLTAEIVHVNRQSEYGKDMVLVGCQYTSRIEI